MNKLDKQYTELLQDILDNGVEKKDRTLTGTISVFGRQIRHKMSEGFPLLTTKKMPFKTIVTELLWFLKGDTNIKYLVDNNCHIWDGDAYKNWCRQFEVDPNNFDGEELAKGHNDQCWGYPTLDHVKPTSKEYKRGQINAYLEGKAEKPFFYLTQEEFINKIKTDDEFAKKWGSLGKIYGHGWRSWTNYTGDEINEGTYEMTNEPIDQISELIKQLKDNPDSRRMVVSAWAVHDLPNMVLPPCHYGFQVYTRELNRLERIQLGLKAGWKPKGYIENFEHEDLNGWDIPTRAISLMWNQRSADTFLGLPFNIASYGLLLEIIAKEVNMVPDELIGNLGDVHLYSNHVEQAKEQIGRELSLEERTRYKKERDSIARTFASYTHQMLDNSNVPTRTREPFPLPTLNIFEPAIGKKISILDNLHIWSPTCFIIENYQSHPTIKATLSN